MSFLPYIWAIFGVALMAAEFLVPGLVIFFFGLGALITALLVGLVPGLGPRIPLQLLLWLAASGLSLFGLRRLVAGVFSGLERKAGGPDPSESEYAGARAVVLEDIGSEKPGRIRFQGTSWPAVAYGEELKTGEKVQILGKENLTFLVTRSFQED